MDKQTKWTWRSKAVWAVLSVFALFIGFTSYRYLFLTAEQAGPIGAHIPERPVAFYAHVLLGATALILGASQFHQSLRRRYLFIHRWLGRAYLIACLAAGLGAIPLALASFGGPVATGGFLFLAIGWLATGALAYWKIRSGDVSGHRRWMLRSYALTFAAVTLRMQIPISQIAGFDYLLSYQTIAWTCWLPNLVIVELYIRWSER